MVASAVPVLAAATAAWLVVAPPAAPRLDRLLRPGRAPRWRADEAPVGAVVGALAGAVLTGGAVGALAGAGVGTAARAWWRRRRLRAEAEAVRRSLPDVLRLLAAELQAGAPPHAALEAAAAAAASGLAAHLTAVAARARLGLDVPGELAPGPPGSDGLAALAACWRVTTTTGGGLADAVTRLAAGLAAEERCRAEVESQLAGPRASALVLAGLPVVAVLMASGLGADPLGFFRRPAGTACLAAGVALDVAGLAWTRAIAARATR